MDVDRYSRSVTMHCSTCAGTQFEYDDEVEDGPMRCTGCDRIYAREELIRENGAFIESEVDEVKDEIVKDLKKSLRNAFKGSKHIRFK